MSDYGIRISKDGVDVKTGADKDMVLTSKYSNLKGSLSGGGSAIIGSPAGGTITISHNLGYIPFALVYFYSVDYGFWWVLPVGFDGANGYLYLKGRTDINNLYIDVQWSYFDDPDITIYYKYFIYLDKGKL